MTAKRPSSMRHLDGAIRRECGGDQAAYVRLRTLMANAVVARMLPDGVVKGGSAIKMRYGNARTRYTTDLDTATATDPTAYAELLGAALACGWEGFTGRVVPREPAHPRDVPEEYVMRPFDVRLAYLGKPWCTVPLEVGHDEIGDADAAAAFAALGLPSPGRGQAAAGVPRTGSCGGRWPRRFCCPDEALLEERRDGRVVRGDAVPQHADAPLPRGLAEESEPLLNRLPFLGHEKWEAVQNSLAILIARTREGSYLSFSMEQCATIAQHHMDSGRIIRTMLAIEHENPSGGIIGRVV